MQPTVLSRSTIKVFVVVIITLLLTVPGSLGGSHSMDTVISSDQPIVSEISNSVEIPAGSDYSIRFNAQNLTLQGQPTAPLTKGLSDTVIAAIAKSPQWIQPALTRQFHNLSAPEPYASLLLNESKQYTDEIAFTIACCPGGKVPSPAILKENAESLYEHDQWIQYAEIIDYDDGAGNYYSTIQYRVLENGTDQSILLPPDIYYWYIVHPKLTLSDIDATYGPLWRDYLFDHNDIGYPLLKEKLSNVQYLWDSTSYSQPAYRLWTTCMSEHPTAIEAVSYWIGKTVPNPAIGDRPGKPCIISHEHNGWCGELQSIAVAAQRAALIPSIPACNVGEDHVWREFFDRGWHENDNWWSDTGGAVDQPDVYGYGWKKNMSAIYEWRGDDTIIDDTARYIHPADRITVTFTVKDAFLRPVDGARVIVLVKGPKDITYYKNLIWGKIQGVWDKLPDILKGRLMTFLFGRLQTSFDTLPDEVHGVTITTWNYTDLDGQCSFQLGKNIEYLFLVQEGNLKAPWQLARHNLLRVLNTHSDKDFRIILPDISQRPRNGITRQMPSGDCDVAVSFASTAYQTQMNFDTGGTGTQEVPGEIDCFFMDAANYAFYKAGKVFTCWNRMEAMNASFSVSTQPQEWYLVFRNHGRDTTVDVTFTVRLAVQTDADHVQIVTPATSLFAYPLFSVGDHVCLSGIATGQVTLTIGSDSYTVDPVGGRWVFDWDTSGDLPEVYPVEAHCGKASDAMEVQLLDTIPPSVAINTPVPGEIIEGSVMSISGVSSDNVGVDRVEVCVDNETWQTAMGTTSWAIAWDLDVVSLGDHLISVKAIDEQGTASMRTIPFVVNESGHSWGPDIISVTQLPEGPVNTSNIVVEANVTMGSPFSIGHVVLYCDNGTVTTAYEMYRYGDSPAQARHEEDPFRNESNAPCYGIELGQYPAGTTVSFWVVAVDTALNARTSEVSSFTIGL